MGEWPPIDTRGVMECSHGSGVDPGRLSSKGAAGEATEVIRPRCHGVLTSRAICARFAQKTSARDSFLTCTLQYLPNLRKIRPEYTRATDNAPAMWQLELDAVRPRAPGGGKMSPYNDVRSDSVVCPIRTAATRIQNGRVVVANDHHPRPPPAVSKRLLCRHRRPTRSWWRATRPAA